ncbi:hypothetical protein M405DRAFT_865873 [Rhizopogon salebrosus TDB-379]|nr:hypothetical protein M405DRAFT_865873 [Rhizopogon salebrosus TDB-379]
MKPFPVDDDWQDLLQQVEEGVCYNTHCTSEVPTLTHWWAIEFEDGDIYFNACCSRCSRANIRSVDGMPIRNVGKISIVIPTPERVVTPPPTTLISFPKPEAPKKASPSPIQSTDSKRPPLPKSSTPCRNYLNCRFGDSCAFAHPKGESRPKQDKPGFSKTEVTSMMKEFFDKKTEVQKESGGMMMIRKIIEKRNPDPRFKAQREEEIPRVYGIIKELFEEKQKEKKPNVVNQNRFGVLAAFPDVEEASIGTKQDHFYIPVVLKGSNKSAKVNALVDSGASSLFLSEKFVEKNSVRTKKLERAIPVRNIDGSYNAAGSIKNYVDLDFVIGDHEEKLVEIP